MDVLATQCLSCSINEVLTVALRRAERGQRGLKLSFTEKRGLVEESKRAVGLDCLSMLLLKFVGLKHCRLKCNNRKAIKVVILEETSTQASVSIQIEACNGQV